ncbi:TPA: hypothetical protein ACH3X2_009003 [Trebouxia sp. C0005]
MQEVPVAAHDLQQPEEALTLVAAPRPAATIRADVSPALQQQAVHERELTALPADVQSVSIHLLQQGAASPAEAPAGGQSEGSLVLQHAPAPEIKVDFQEVPANEAVPSGGACSKQQQDSTASSVSNAKRVEVKNKPAPALGLDLTLPGSHHAQEVPVAAHDLQQSEEALTLAAAPRPAAPIRAFPPHDSPALQQQAVHVAEATALPADEQPVGNHAFQQGAASSAEAPAGGQLEGSLALQQAPAPETRAQVDSQEVPANEAGPSGGACSKQQQDSTASLVSDAKRVEVEEKSAVAMASNTIAMVGHAMTTIKLDEQPKSSLAGSLTTDTASYEPANPLDEEEQPRREVPGVSIQAGPVPSSPVKAHKSPQAVKEAARPAVPATSSQAEAVTSSPVKAPSSPQSLKEGDSPVSPMKEMSFAGSADTLAGARAVMTDKAAADATAGVPPANGRASQPVTPATTESTPPELTDAAAAKAATGVPPAVTDASLDSKEGEAGHAAEAHAAGAVQRKGGATWPSATMSEAEPKANAEGKAAPNSSSALSEANVEPSTHAAEGFIDNRAAADSPEADVKAKATPTGPAEESSAANTIAAKHAAGSAFTTPKTSASSSPAQTKPERQAAKSKVVAQTASSAAAAAASPPIAPAQSDINSAPAPTAAAAAAKGSANVDAAGAAVTNPAAADAAVPGSSLCIVPAVDQAAAKPAALPAAAKPAVCNATATDAANTAPASGGYAAAAVPRSAQIGRELKPVNESSEGLSEGEYKVVAGADYLEQLKDPHKRRLSDGATAVVNL